MDDDAANVLMIRFVFVEQVCRDIMIMSGKVSEKVEAVIKGLLLGYGGYRAVADLYRLWYQWRNNQKKIGGEDVVDLGNNEAAMLARRKPPEMWNTAIFFPDLQLGKEGSPTKQLIGLIENARISIQICVYLTSYVPLEEAILKKYSQGLIIQVVTCHETMTAHNNHFKRWKDNLSKICFGTIVYFNCRHGKLEISFMFVNYCLEIPVRMKCTRYLMHNKFVIIDDEAVITGSLNWTTQVNISLVFSQTSLLLK